MPPQKVARGRRSTRPASSLNAPEADSTTATDQLTETEPLLGSKASEASMRTDRPIQGRPAGQSPARTHADSTTAANSTQNPGPGLMPAASSTGILAELWRHFGAVLWSMFFSLGVIMTAYDPQLLGNLYATPAFQRDFGYLYRGRYVIKASWQTGLSMGGPIGQIVGALAATYPMERFGRKKTFGGCVILTALLVWIQFRAKSLPVLLVGELLGGTVLGTYAVIAPAYASEGILTSYINLCFVLGQLLANCVVAVTSQWDSEDAYRIPFATQWVWPAVISLILPWAPESPYWLVRKGRVDEARASLQRLSSPEVDVEPTLADIVVTDRFEQELAAGTTYWDCFRDINYRRTQIAMGVYGIQVSSGVYLVGYATYFFELAGMPTADAFGLGIAFLGLGVIGTILSWFFLERLGRRSLYLLGLSALIVLLFAIGILDCAPNYSTNKAIVWAQSGLLLAWNFVYDLSIGPVCFVILSEVSATKVRSQTIAIATAAQAFLAILMTIAIPYLINPDQANLRGRIGFFFGALSAVGLLWAWFRVPETSGRTYEELDIMFSRKVKTRRFRTYRITR